MSLLVRLLLLKVAGLAFSFDSTKPPGERVVSTSVMIGSEPLDLNQTYRLCTKAYVAKGKDGYDCLAGSEMIVNEDDGPQLSTIIQNHFKSVSHLTGQRRFQFHHHQSIISRCLRRTLSRHASTLKQDETDHPAQVSVSEDSRCQSGGSRRRWQKARIALTFARHRIIAEAETKKIKAALAPKVQQRIRNLGDGIVY